MGLMRPRAAQTNVKRTIETAARWIDEVLEESKGSRGIEVFPNAGADLRNVFPGVVRQDNVSTKEPGTLSKRK